MTDSSNDVSINSRYELLYKLAVQWGLPTVIMCVLMYVGYLEHVYQREVLTKTNDFIQQGLTTIIKDNLIGTQKLHDAVSANQVAILQNQKLMIELTAAVRTMDEHIRARLNGSKTENANK